RTTLVEKSSALIDLGQKLGPDDWIWQRADIARTEFVEHDLVTASYVLGEFPEAGRLRVAKAAWAAAKNVLLVIEPGSPRGFEVIREIRDALIADGAHVVAPCPHDRACPMGGGRWCHFPVRLQRSELQRRIK